MLNSSRKLTTGNKDPRVKLPADNPAVPAVGLGMLLRSTDMSFNRALREELGGHGVTFSQFQHLRQLWEEDGLTQVAISRRIGIQMASSTSVLDSLERARLIRRIRQAEDRRKINVFLTPVGRALKSPLMAAAVRVNARARRGISTDAMAMLFRNLEAIAANLTDR
jgi:DNA-binding MarR family transcriptional regulator